LHGGIIFSAILPMRLFLAAVLCHNSRLPVLAGIRSWRGSSRLGQLVRPQGYIFGVLLWH